MARLNGSMARAKPVATLEFRFSPQMSGYPQKEKRKEKKEKEGGEEEFKLQLHKSN